MNDQPPEPKKYPWNDNIRTILIAILLAVTFRSFVFEPFHIPSGSMKSTLLVGDYLFVSKYAYGYSRYSFPFGLPIFKGRILETKPQRGDIVVFRFPKNPRIDFIKRIMGMPGDYIQVRQGIVYINGKPLPRTPIDTYEETEGRSSSCLETRQPTPESTEFWQQMPELMRKPEQGSHAVPHLSETLPEGKIITILKECERGMADNTINYKVPAGHYFMMGDNRDNSSDSRLSVGFVPEENLVGRAEFIFFSTDGSADWLNPVSWFSAMRLDRFFKHIE
jgi:signal peptidase I